MDAKRTIKAPFWDENGVVFWDDFDLPDVERIIRSAEGYRRVHPPMLAGNAERLARKLIELESLLKR